MLPHRESNQGFATFRLLARHSTNWTAPPLFNNWASKRNRLGI